MNKVEEYFLGAKILCLFGNETIAATILSSSLVICTSPSTQRSGTVELRLSFHGFQSSNHVSFIFLEPVLIVKGTTFGGTLQGKIPVTIHGNKFDTSQSLEHSVGGTTVPLLFFSNKAASCYSPPSTTQGHVLLSLVIK